MSVQPTPCQRRYQCQHLAINCKRNQNRRCTARILRAAAQRQGAGVFNKIDGQTHESTRTLQQQHVQAQLTSYPFIDTTHPGVEQLSAEPPVYLVHNLLQPGHCHALQQAALRGQLPAAEYNDAVLFDYHKLSYLSIVVVMGAVAQAVHAWQDGAALGAIIQSACAGATVWSCIAVLLALGVKRGVEIYTEGRCFTGSKWSTDELQPGNPAAEAVDAFTSNVCKLLQTEPSKLEVPLVTR